MFVYQRMPSRKVPLGSKERFFRGTERSPKLAPNKVLVIACALMFGGLSKALSLPAAAFGFTVLVLAWLFADESDEGEPVWVHRLSLGVTGLFYFGLGSCLGWPAVAVVGLLTYHRDRIQ